MKNEENDIAEIFDFIDVNSGVEDQPGFKNEEKLEELYKLYRIEYNLLNIRKIIIF